MLEEATFIHAHFCLISKCLLQKEAATVYCICLFTAKHLSGFHAHCAKVHEPTPSPHPGKETMKYEALCESQCDVTFHKVARKGHIAPNKSRKGQEPEEHNSPWIRLQDCQHLINFSPKFDIIGTERFTVICQQVRNICFGSS